ncbi:MAG: hypothetical protein M0017_05135 [Desulfobacteraceae bacterium]|nr:hypothetical protein [Desulfobacteraceae bacterium]
MQIARTRRFLFPLLAATLLMTGGCAGMNLGGSTGDSATAEAASAEPNANPTDFKDIMVPTELSYNREKSMVIRTASFAGGILSFSGRVDMSSLTDYFIASMQKDGWKLNGSIKYKNVLLAFTKPQKTSLINIYPNSLGYKTDVSIYVTEEIGAGDAGGARAF